MSSITSTFYALGGYNSSSSGFPDYVSVDTVTATYVPYGVNYFNKLCEGTHTASVSYTGTTSSGSTGDPYDDRIVVEMALSYADSIYTANSLKGVSSAMHKAIAEEMILKMYGVNDRYGRLVFPIHSDDRVASTFIGVSVP